MKGETADVLASKASEKYGAETKWQTPSDQAKIQPDQANTKNVVREEVKCLNRSKLLSNILTLGCLRPKSLIGLGCALAPPGRNPSRDGALDMARRERVTRVIDGDTFQTTSRKKSVRLANVDAPEKGESGSVAATKFLRSLIQGEIVTIDTVARDKYGRCVANVKIGRKSVNKAIREKVRKK